MTGFFRVATATAGDRLGHVGLTAFGVVTFGVLETPRKVDLRLLRVQIGVGVRSDLTRRVLWIGQVH